MYLDFKKKKHYDESSIDSLNNNNKVFIIKNDLIKCKLILHKLLLHSNTSLKKKKIIKFFEFLIEPFFLLNI